MGSFSAATKAVEAAGAPRVVTLPLAGWADTWHGKPSNPTPIGLKLLASTDIEQARLDAIRQAVRWYDDGDLEPIDAETRDDAFNEALMRFAVARATCQPDDPKLPYFELAEETIRAALTLEGIRFLWDELVILHRGSSVIQAPINDDETAALAKLLAHPGAVERIDSGVRGEVQRLLGYCLAVLQAVNPDVDDEPDEPTYYVKGE